MSGKRLDELPEDIVPFPIEGDDLEAVVDAAPEPSRGNGKASSLTTSAADLAEQYLAETGRTLVYWRDCFYEWVGTHYCEIPDTDLKADVVRFLQTSSNRKNAGTRSAGEVICNLGGLRLVAAGTEPPALLGSGIASQVRSNLIPLRNWILNVDEYLRDGSEPLLPHSPMYFFLHSLPYDFDITKGCETFSSILSDNLPDPAHRDFLQEWFGYNVVADSRLERFMIFPGEAGTGKTVVCTVLASMLGPDSISAVPLEAFNPTRTFPLAAMAGKLANIAEEIGECDKAAEGLLKQLVTGSPITIERKHRDPFILRNRARLTFATNVLPRFADRSNGIWRRMLVLPFCQVVPTETQDPRFLDSEWWLASGELPGIFLWALEGLKRLRTRGRFQEPPECKVIREEYKRESNPAGVFLLDNCEFELTATTPAPVLYKAYAGYVRELGHYPLSEALFAREVRRLFPLAEKQKHPTRQVDGSRVRLWLGIRFDGRTTP